MNKENYLQVACITTDNDSNFCAAFRVDAYAETGDEEEEEQAPIEKIVVALEEMEQISDTEVLQTKPLQLENLLKEHDALSLTEHRRCISYTLNILSTKDVSNVPRWSSGTKIHLIRHLPKHLSLIHISEPTRLLS